MQRNLRLYPWFLAFQQMHFWIPVFFLYFSSVLSIDQVLLLEAVYYLAVVVLEVPSGYFSDRIGRRVTLLLEVVLIAVMASFVHKTVLLLLLIRSVPSALSRPATNAVIHHRLPSGIRATYFSVQSLAGQLAFSSTLFVASWSVPDSGALTVNGMSHVLDGFITLALFLSPVLAFAAITLNRRVND